MYNPLTPEEEAIINSSFEEQKPQDDTPVKEPFRLCPIMAFALIFTILAVLLYFGYRAIGTEKGTSDENKPIPHETLPVQ